jgi:Sulfotransferase family
VFSFLKRPRYKGKMKQLGFIVGTGRCGTTILAQVLNSHSKICVPHELQIIVSIGNGDRLYDKFVKGEMGNYTAEDFIRLIDACCPYYFERYFDYIGHFRSLRYPQTDLRKLLTELFDHICFEYRKEIFLEQTPWYGQRLEILKELFPEMKVIHVIRDGRDVAMSFARTPWWTKDIRSNLLQWEREVNVIHDFVSRDRKNYLEIRYEDLVLNPAIVLQEIVGLLDLQYEQAMLEPEKLIDYFSFFKGDISKYQSRENRDWGKKKRNVFFPGSLYAWKRYQEFDFSKLPGTVGASLQKFRYEI